MGVDTQAHISKDFDAGMVATFVEKRFDTEVKLINVEGRMMVGYHQLMFNLNGDNRMINFHTGIGIFGSNLVTMGMDEDSKEVMKSLCEQFSGVYIPNDCEDDDGTGAKMFDGSAAYNEGNAEYLLKWALSNDYIKDSRVKDIEEASRRFENEVTNRVRR